MGQTIPFDSFCLDPSCLASLQNLQDTLKILTSLKDHVQEFTVNIPSKLYDVINLPPEDKFQQLPPLIEDWVQYEEIESINTLSPEKRKRYVDIMRTILESFNVQSFSFISEGADRIGEESIYLKDLISKFGKRVGEIIFDVTMHSWELHSKIISFGENTIQLLKNFGVASKEARSQLKKILKSKANVKTSVKFFTYCTAFTFVEKFIVDYGLDPSVRDFNIAIGIGLLVIGNG